MPTFRMTVVPLCSGLSSPRKVIRGLLDPKPGGATVVSISSPVDSKLHVVMFQITNYAFQPQSTLTGLCRAFNCSFLPNNNNTVVLVMEKDLFPVR
jgi:hypothetical protein